MPSIVGFNSGTCIVQQCSDVAAVIVVNNVDKSYIVYDLDPDTRTTTMPSARSVEAYLARSSSLVPLHVIELPSRSAAMDVIAARYTERGIDFERIGYAVKRIVERLVVPITSVSYKLNRTGESSQDQMNIRKAGWDVQLRILVLCVPVFSV